MGSTYAREVYGDNGATKFQSMVYRHVLWNTGWFAGEGLRDGDADLLLNLITNDDFGRHDFQKGLWLNGNGMPGILTNPNRPYNYTLLTTYAGARLLHNGLPYRHVADDSTLCVRLDPSEGRHFPTSGESYGSLRGNGCPMLLDFTVMGTNQSGVGNLEYVDQDAGETITPYASISNDQFAPTNAANYGVVIDAWSLHYLRSTPDGWTGEDCGTNVAAITQRTHDVLSWLGAIPLVSLGDVNIATPGSDVTPISPSRTRLLPNTPNPFNPRTTVRYQLTSPAQVNLVVFDVNGKALRTLVDRVQSPDAYEVDWDGTTEGGRLVASGVYWIRMTTSAGYRATTKMVLLR